MNLNKDKRSQNQKEIVNFFFRIILYLLIESSSYFSNLGSMTLKEPLSKKFFTNDELP